MAVLDHQPVLDHLVTLNHSIKDTYNQAMAVDLSSQDSGVVLCNQAMAVALSSQVSEAVLCNQVSVADSVRNNRPHNHKPMPQLSHRTSNKEALEWENKS